MARSVSLHVGLNSVDPSHYDGWDGQLTACEFDANDMHAIAGSLGYDESTKLLTADATAEAVLGAIERVAGTLEAGDLFFVSYSGHGGQVQDRDDEGETDRSDETWVAYDRQIVDDELFVQWGKFAEGVRIIVLSDSCHSGTVLKAIDDHEGRVPNPVANREIAAEQSPRYRAMPWDVVVATYREHKELYDGIQKDTPDAPKDSVSARVLLISGCQDDQLSSDGMANGLFTENLLDVWNKGEWDGGGYEAFAEAIRSQMPAEQQPNYYSVGNEDPEFEAQKPFTA